MYRCLFVFVRFFNAKHVREEHPLLRRPPFLRRTTHPFFEKTRLLRRTPAPILRRPSSSEEPPLLRRTLPFSFFGPESQRTSPSSIFDLRSRRSKTSIFVLRKRKSKNPSPSSIFGPEDRRTPHLQSSIFGAEDRRTPHLRYSAPKNGSKIGRKKRGWDFFFRRTKNLPPSSTFSAEERRTPHLPHSWPEEWTKDPLWYFFFRPPGHQLPSAILRSGSSDRSSTLKIGPKIEVSFLLGVRRTHVSLANCSVGVPSCPAPPGRPPCAPTRPVRGMSGFWTRQVNLLVNMERMSFDYDELVVNSKGLAIWFGSQKFECISS